MTAAPPARTARSDEGLVHWRLHLRSPPATVYAALATAEGRARFWAESAPEQEGIIFWRFPNGVTGPMKILARTPPQRFVVEYFDNSVVTFELTPDEHGGTELLLTHAGVPLRDRAETRAGWVSVLLALKAQVDHGVDLRNHEPTRSWDQGYVEN